ncbi:MAG: radical SAM protein [Saccharofermentans sp.]|nr:radical SAM protein [Saccharofermentans sp.]
MLTDRCTAECSFCGLSCGPSCHGLMDMSLAKKAIDEASIMGTFERIGLTGGEAFLYPELIKEILEYARAKGFEQRTVATNGFWGQWSDEKTDEVIGSLSSLVSFVSISHDAFHAEYVKTEYVWRAIEALERHSIPYSISIADVFGDKGAGEFLASLDDKAFYKQYSIYPLSAVGRAESLSDSMFVRYQNKEDTVCYPEGIVSVNWDGDVYPCCAPGIFATEFKLGNLKDSSLPYLLTKTRCMRYINVMADPVRFRRLLEYATDVLGIDLPDKAVSGCELCYKIFSNPGITDNIASFMDDQYHDLLMSRLLGEER